jgi:hypothetical protein
MEAVIEQVWKCTWRLRSGELRAALGGRDRLSLEMHLEVVTERVWRCNWRSRLSELRDTLPGRDPPSLEMHLEAVIDRVGDALGGHNRAQLVQYLEVVNLGAVGWRNARC